MTAENNPGHRYLSVEQLSLDIQRFLDKRPVSATRQSFPYRASRFPLRHFSGSRQA